MFDAHAQETRHLGVLKYEKTLRLAARHFLYAAMITRPTDGKYVIELGETEDVERCAYSLRAKYKFASFLHIVPGAETYRFKEMVCNHPEMVAHKYTGPVKRCANANADADACFFQLDDKWPLEKLIDIMEMYKLDDATLDDVHEMEIEEQCDLYYDNNEFRKDNYDNNEFRKDNYEDDLHMYNLMEENDRLTRCVHKRVKIIVAQVNLRGHMDRKDIAALDTATEMETQMNIVHTSNLYLADMLRHLDVAATSG